MFKPRRGVGCLTGSMRPGAIEQSLPQPVRQRASRLDRAAAVHPLAPYGYIGNDAEQSSCVAARLAWCIRCRILAQIGATRHHAAPRPFYHAFRQALPFLNTYRAAGIELLYIFNMQQRHHART